MLQLLQEFQKSGEKSAGKSLIDLIRGTQGMRNQIDKLLNATAKGLKALHVRDISHAVMIEAYRAVSDGSYGSLRTEMDAAAAAAAAAGCPIHSACVALQKAVRDVPGASDDIAMDRMSRLRAFATVSPPPDEDDEDDEDEDDEDEDDEGPPAYQFQIDFNDDDVPDPYNFY
jgi:hypothetical protein